MSTPAHDLANAFGFLLPGETDALQQLAGMVPEDATMVNIGAGAGTSSLAIAEIRPNAKRYTIDISAGGPLGGMQNEVNAFKVTPLKLPTQILGDSKQAGKDWNRGKVDFLFIDGDHSIAGATGDILNWLPHMKEGGIVAVHDYNSVYWGDVVKVVDEHLGKYEKVLQVQTVIAFRV
jgi:predicted O-methyltransferase YrrM